MRAMLAGHAIYAAPEDGWAYTYEGDQDANDEAEALDGGWTHTDNDHWDGSGPGDPDSSPGGIKSFTEGDINYLRVQDTGDPRGLGFDDAVSNRKMSLNRNLVELDGISPSFLDDGFTFYMKVRLASDGPLDAVTFDGSEEPWPENGRGSDIDFDGTGFFTINQKESEFATGPLSFALADAEFGLADLGGAESGGLIANNLASFEPSDQVDTGEVSEENDVLLNLVPLDDLTEWHDLWINVVASDPLTGDGTHTVNVFVDGSLEPIMFETTVGTADRFEDFCICPSFTSGAAAVDIDFISYANGVLTPTIADDGGGGSDLSDVSSPEDEIVRVDGENDGDGSDGPPPGAETVERAIDDVGQKYLNFLDLGSGFTVTPAAGPSLVTGLRLFTANDAIERDPASYVLEGGLADGTFTVISEGELSLPDERNAGGDTALDENSAQQEITFDNSVVYTSYRLTFPTLKDAEAANSMQISEVEFLGEIVLSDVTSPGDEIVRVDGENDGDGSDGPPPGAETVERAIDDVGQKYLNFLDLGSGFTVTPSAGESVVTGLRLFTANDAIERDPASYVLEGGLADGTFTVISEGELSLPDERNAGGDTALDESSAQQEITFENTQAYVSYRLTFPTLKDAEAANSMQIAEVEFLGQVIASAALPGDIDGDGSVGFSDFTILADSFGQEVDPGTVGDIDGDGMVGFSDFTILADNFGNTVPAMAPAAVDAAFAV